jgi:molecular chaperone HtpG
MAVGKNFLENLTVAMYENSFTVYREFVQNAADSIDKAIAKGIIDKDEACIDIHIEYNKRRITVFDNACGISMREFKKKMMDVADSDKDRDTEKGFRGIGRLAGLGYCDKLIFRTTARGEDKESVITWDGIKLKTIVDDPKQHPSSDELIETITEVQYKPAETSEHYFEVIMEDVSFESDDLLDEQQVIKYLQAVAPVPYANYFIFSSKIHDYAANNNFAIDEYVIIVNGNQLYKPYRTKLYEGTSDSKKEYDEIYDVDFKIFTNNSGTPIAWMWYGIAKYEKQIPVINEMRCIRLRKENIQIGDESTIGYPRFYREPRGNSYYIGEVFAFDKGLIPNARRDYFNQNPAAKQFEEALHNFFYTELYDLYHYASKVRSAQKVVTNYQKKEEEYQKKLSTAGFIDVEEQEAAAKEIAEERTKSAKAEREIENRRRDAENSNILNRVFSEIEKTYKNPEKPPTPKKDVQEKEEKPNKYLTQSLSKYNKKEQKLIAKIYNIIKMMLPKDMADIVIKKIQEELSK